MCEKTICRLPFSPTIHVSRTYLSAKHMIVRAYIVSINLCVLVLSAVTFLDLSKKKKHSRKNKVASNIEAKGERGKKQNINNLQIT